MKKPTELRAHLTQWLPDLAQNPDKLHLFIEKGRLASRAGARLSFEYRYDLKILLTDYGSATDALMVPLLAWIAVNQPNLLEDSATKDGLLPFVAEFIDHDKLDIEITLPLIERVRVSPEGNGYRCDHLDDPAPPDLGGPTGWEIFINGELVVQGNG